MSDVIIEKLRTFVELEGQYRSLTLEQDVVTEQVIATVTTARLEAIDLALIRWQDVYTRELKTLEGLCKEANSAPQPGWHPQA